MGSEELMLLFRRELQKRIYVGSRKEISVLVEEIELAVTALVAQVEISISSSCSISTSRVDTSSAILGEVVVVAVGMKDCFTCCCSSKSHVW